MTRRWLNSMDVEVGENGAPLFDMAGCASFVGGTKTVASSATPEALVAASTPCRLVWIGARIDDNGNSLNTTPVFIGDSNSQNIPVMSTNYEGFVIRINDAQKVFVRATTNGEGVAYRILA